MGETNLSPPTFADVLAARSVVGRHLRRTSLANYPSLDALVGARTLVKHENQQPTGAFKVRGGVNLVSRLSAEERGGGVIAASTGNHGQSVAYAARLFGVRATVVVPEAANPLKVSAMRGRGGAGRGFEAARTARRADGGAGAERRQHHGRAAPRGARRVTDCSDLSEFRRVSGA